MAAVVSARSLEDRFPLHLAVWDDDEERLESLLTAGGHDLEALDPQSNTPLLLAYRLGRTRLARMLLATGSFPKARTPEGFEAVQVAALTSNPDLVRTAVLSFLSETDAAFERRLPTLQRALAELPDFVMRLSWEFTSWVPGLSRLLPNDAWYVSKRGSSLRLDSTLLGMNGLKWERGSISLILWGSDRPRPGATFVLDNEARTAADARLAFTHPQDQHVQVSRAAMPPRACCGLPVPTQVAHHESLRTQLCRVRIIKPASSCVDLATRDLASSLCITHHALCTIIRRTGCASC